MSKVLQELCYALIQSTYGELCAQLFSVLAAHGRLNVHQLVEHSQLRPRQVRHGLTVMIEHHVVQRIIPDDRSNAVYQVNYKSAYNIVRHDNIIQLVHDRWGEDASVIIAVVIDSGHARVGDIIDASLMASSRRDARMDTTLSNRNHGNGTHKINDEVAYWHARMRKLLHAGILVKVGQRSYVPYHDLQEELEETVIGESFPDRKINGPKKRLEFIAAVQRLRRQWQNEEEYSDQRDVERSGTGSNKRIKLNGGHTSRIAAYHDDNVGDDHVRISSDLIVRVNHTRCTIAMRSQRLQKLAEHYLGETTAVVYGALLNTLETKTGDSDAETVIQPLTATLAEVNEHLDSQVEVATAIEGLSNITVNGSRGSSNRKRTRNVHEDQEIDEIKAEDYPDATRNMKELSDFQSRNARLSGIEAHLCVLQEHSKHFCQRDPTQATGREDWQVDVKHLNTLLVRAELDEVVLNRYGPTQLRIIRLLREKGKLDEKQIASMAMMFPKDVYVLLTCLQFEGILEGQEIPKDNSRQPNKSLYLWYIDDSRVSDLLLQQTYKIMTRHLQRVYVERQHHRTILEKASRSDVRGREQEKLSNGEKQILRQLRENEERLLTQVARLDELVGVFRDFGGTDISLRG